jgi:hypothetical protein
VLCRLLLTTSVFYSEYASYYTFRSKKMKILRRKPYKINILFISPFIPVCVFEICYKFVLPECSWNYLSVYFSVAFLAHLLTKLGTKISIISHTHDTHKLLYTCNVKMGRIPFTNCIRIMLMVREILQ